MPPCSVCLEKNSTPLSLHLEISNEHNRLRRRYLETFSAPHIFAHQLIVDADHVVARLLELCTFKLAQIARRIAFFCSFDPANVVIVSLAARRARVVRLLCLLSLIKNIAFMHNANIVALLPSHWSTVIWLSFFGTLEFSRFNIQCQWSVVSGRCSVISVQRGGTIAPTKKPDTWNTDHRPLTTSLNETQGP